MELERLVRKQATLHAFRLECYVDLHYSATVIWISGEPRSGRFQQSLSSGFNALVLILSTPFRMKFPRSTKTATGPQDSKIVLFRKTFHYSDVRYCNVGVSRWEFQK